MNASTSTIYNAPVHAVPSIYHGLTVQSVYPEIVAAALSLVGDVLLIGTFAVSPPVRKVVALRLIVPLAVANLFGSIFFFLLVFGDPLTEKNPAVCDIAAAGVWYFMWAAWLWTVPYAKFVRDVFCHDGGDGGGADASRGTTVCGGGARTSAGSVQDASHGLARGLDGRLEREWIARREVVCHAICWGVPLLQIVLFGLLDAFGQHDSDQVSGEGGCSLVPPRDVSAQMQRLFSAGASTALWLGISYNLFAFVSAHYAMRRSRCAATSGTGHSCCWCRAALLRAPLLCLWRANTCRHPYLMAPLTLPWRPVGLRVGTRIDFATVLHSPIRAVRAPREPW